MRYRYYQSPTLSINFYHFNPPLPAAFSPPPPATTIATTRSTPASRPSLLAGADNNFIYSCWPANITLFCPSAGPPGRLLLYSGTVTTRPPYIYSNRLLLLAPQQSPAPPHQHHATPPPPGHCARATRSGDASYRNRYRPPTIVVRHPSTNQHHQTCWAGCRSASPSPIVAHRYTIARSQASLDRQVRVGTTSSPCSPWTCPGRQHRPTPSASAAAKRQQPAAIATAHRWPRHPPPGRPHRQQQARRAPARQLGHLAQTTTNAPGPLRPGIACAAQSPNNNCQAARGSGQARPRRQPSPAGCQTDSLPPSHRNPPPGHWGSGSTILGHGTRQATTRRPARPTARRPPGKRNNKSTCAGAQIPPAKPHARAGARHRTTNAIAPHNNNNLALSPSAGLCAIVHLQHFLPLQAPPRLAGWLHTNNTTSPGIVSLAVPLRHRHNRHQTTTLSARHHARVRPDNNFRPGQAPPRRPATHRRPPRPSPAWPGPGQATPPVALALPRSSPITHRVRPPGPDRLPRPGHRPRPRPNKQQQQTSDRPARRQADRRCAQATASASASAPPAVQQQPDNQLHQTTNTTTTSPTSQTSQQQPEQAANTSQPAPTTPGQAPGCQVRHQTTGQTASQHQAPAARPPRRQTDSTSQAPGQAPDSQPAPDSQTPARHQACQAPGPGNKRRQAQVACPVRPAPTPAAQARQRRPGQATSQRQAGQTTSARLSGAAGAPGTSAVAGGCQAPASARPDTGLRQAPGWRQAPPAPFARCRCQAPGLAPGQVHASTRPGALPRP